MDLKNLDLLLFFVFVLPGLISMKVYRLILPSADVDWKTALIEGLFFSSVTLLLLLPVIYLLFSTNWSDSLKIIISSILILIASIGLPFLLKYLLTKSRLSEIFKPSLSYCMGLFL